jgi:nicotinate (nicotinamide) nucleotide adenylyltransferase
MSPTSDYYEKRGLIAAEHRLAMARLAISDSGWMEVDQWEADQPQWTETVKVMRHFHEQADKDCQLKLLCGADLLESFAVPDLWKEEDIEEIVGRFGMVVVSRPGFNPYNFIAHSPQLTRLKVPSTTCVHTCHCVCLLFYIMQNAIEIIEDPTKSELSATLVRNSIKKGWSVKYLVPDPVIEYIKAHNLYKQ